MSSRPIVRHIITFPIIGFTGWDRFAMAFRSDAGIAQTVARRLIAYGGPYAGFDPEREAEDSGSELRVRTLTGATYRVIDKTGRVERCASDGVPAGM